MWPFNRAKETIQKATKWATWKPRQRNFQAGEADRLVAGWTTSTSTVNAKLRTTLTPMRARSRDQAENNPIAKRFLKLMKRNVVGPNGIRIQAKSIRNGALDTSANNAIEAAFLDWSENDSDYQGQLSFVDQQGLSIMTAATDGEFLFEIMRGSGRYGLQLRAIDPEILDVTRNQEESNGNITRLGVEYDKRNRPAKYWFRDIDSQGNYYGGSTHTIPARNIYHCYIPEWIDQARGIPWMHSGLFRLKMLDGYDVAAITAARAGAAKMGFISGEGPGQYTGDEVDEETGDMISDFEAGTIEQLPDGKEFTSFDPNYPHEQYSPFTKKAMRDVGVGFDLSYPSLSGDLEGANYSSIRWGGLDEREMYIEVQNWLIRCLIRPVFKEWLSQAVPKGAIKIGRAPLRRPVDEYYPAHYQGRRWTWVDPQKEMKANADAIDNKLRSRSSIIRDMGEDPETVWREIAAENKLINDMIGTDNAEQN